MLNSFELAFPRSAGNSFFTRLIQKLLWDEITMLEANGCVETVRGHLTLENRRLLDQSDGRERGRVHLP
jgi:hypothetical protein